MKKVIVVGSHGTGKTVLSKRLIEECEKEFPGKKIKMLDGLATEAKKKGYKLNIFESQSQAIKAQLVVLRLYLNAMRLRDVDIIIVPDNLCRQFAYSRYNMMPEEFTDLLRDLVRDELKDALILYLPIEFALPWDRHPSDTFHKQIDEMLIELLEGLDVDFITVKGDVEARTKRAMEAIREFCKF
jgi:Cdc6-like AAA superfamily ATPase